jgi:hypothetical protein
MAQGQGEAATPRPPIKPCRPFTAAGSNATSACWPPLAFVSPRIVAAILDGTAPAGLTITTLARAALVLGRAGDWV